MNTESELTEYELTSKVGERVKEQLEALKTTIAKELKEIVWTACNDYAEYAEWEPLENWRNRERDDLVSQKYCLHKDSFWGKSMRDQMFEEHKEVIIPMIKDEQFEKMQKEVERLTEALKQERAWARDRFSH